MSPPDPAAAQRAFYDRGRHEHLRAREDDLYARNLADRLARAAALGPGDRVLEVGAGFGRFTFPLLAHCAAIDALDLSQRLLDELVRTRDERGVDAGRLRAHCRDACALSDGPPLGPYAAVAGFYFLHHLPALEAPLRGLASLLAPGGRMVFLEPNRRNPQFLLQVALCPDMPWSEEKGMFRLTAPRVEDAYRSAGLVEVTTETFGFFPPPVYNASAAARGLERRLERVRLLRGALPFLLVSGRAPL